MIRPTFLGFETAKRALTIAQLGLDTVGHNISNASTPGYTRQRVDQVSIASSGYRMKYQTFGVQFPGQGADVSGINQIRDPYLDKLYRTQATTYGELSVKNNGLISINNILDEITTDGLHAKISDLINRLDLLAQQADSPDMATVVRNTANELVHLFNESSKSLDIAREEQINDLNISVSLNVNHIVKQIADLNVKIKEDNFYGNPSLELNDSRNLLLDQLSEYIDIKVIRTPVKISSDLTIERVSVELNNSGNPPIVLIDSGMYNNLSVKEDETTGKVSIHIVDGLSGFPIEPDNITDKLFKGGLKGYLDIINGEGPTVGAGYVGGNTFRGIPYYKESLNDLASQFAEVMNRLNNISDVEITANGCTFQTSTFAKNLFVPLSATVAGYTGSNNWIGGFQAGTLELSGGVYNMAFTTDGSSPPGEVYASVTVGGKTTTYTAKYDGSAPKIEFLASDGSVAFSVTNNGVDPENGSSIKLDARVTAANIAVSQNWFADPLYITATKLDPVNKQVLSLSGTAPSWMQTVAVGDVPVVNGNYKFELTNPGAPPSTVQVTIDGVIYVSTKNWQDMAPGERIEFTDGTNVGLIVTLSDTFDPANDGAVLDQPINAAVTIKSVTAAANDNLLKFKVAFTESYTFANGVRGTFQEYLVSLQGDDAALDLNMNETLLATSDKVISQYADRRDAISAVNADEEAINMMTYQNYYNAAARYMTTLDEALDKVINGMGIVGR